MRGVNAWHSSSLSGPFLFRFSALRQGMLCGNFGPAHSKRRRSFSPAILTLFKEDSGKEV